MAKGINNKGDLRGKAWIPKEAICKGCGQPFWKDTARREYCDECRGRSRRNYRRRELRREQREKGRPADIRSANTGEPHVCRYSRSCEYGNGFKLGCNYFMKMGEFRSIDGKHQIINGKCDLYKRRSRKRRTQNDFDGFDF